MRNRADPLRSVFDGLVRRAAWFGGAVIVASCTGERTETSTSASARVVAADVVDEGPTGTGCPDPSSSFIEVTGLDAGTTMFRSSCANATGDFGAVAAVGGPFWRTSNPTEPAVLLEACTDRSSGAAKISIMIGDASSPGSIYFRDAQGNVFFAFKDPVDRTALRIGPIGGTIEGTYQATLFTKKADVTIQTFISGSFRVCHLQDVDLTPVK
jgi:hypothetical protein